MPLGIGPFLLGAFVLALYSAGAVQAGRVLGRRLWSRGTKGSLMIAQATAGLAVLLGVAQVVGAVGLFNIWALAISGLVLLGGFTWWSRRQARPERIVVMPPLRSKLWALLPPVLILIPVLARWGAGTGVYEKGGIEEYDSMWYHLPQALAMAQSGWVTRFHFVSVDKLTGFYPANNEIIHALGMIAFSRDFVSPLWSLLWLGGVLAGAWVLTSRIRPAWLGLVFAGMVMSAPWFVQTQAGTAKDDTWAAMLLLFAMAPVVDNGESMGPVLVSGLAAGLAVSTRVTYLLIVPFVCVVVASGRPAGRRLRSVLVWTLGFALTGIYWYIRNWVRTGSPLPFLGTSIGPIRLARVPHPDGGPANYSILQALTHHGFTMAIIRSAEHHVFGPAWTLVLLLPAIGFVVGPFAGRTARSLSILGVVATAAYLVTPQTGTMVRGRVDPGHFFQAQRLLMPGLLCGMLALALAVVRLGRVATYVLLAVVAVITEISVDKEVGASSREFVLALAVELAVAAAVLLWTFLPRAGIALGAGAVGLSAVAAMALFVAQHREAAGEWTYPSPAVAHVWTYFGRIQHSKVAEYGFNLQYPLGGRTLTNRVTYIGAGGPPPNCTVWRDDLIAGRYQYVVTGLDAPTSPPEAAWTLAMEPQGLVAQYQQYSIFHLTQPLLPCPRP